MAIKRVYIVPGFMGSALLMNTNRTPFGISSYRPYWLDLDVMRRFGPLAPELQDREGTPSADGYRMGEVEQNYDAPADLYAPLRDALVKAGYQVYLFTYDWRLPLQRAADLFVKKLRADANDDGYVVIGHSAGMRLALHALHALITNEGRGNWVRTIALAPCIRGSWNAVAALGGRMAGLFQFLGILNPLDGLGSFGVMTGLRKFTTTLDARYTEVVQTWAGLYDQLPAPSLPNFDTSIYVSTQWKGTPPKGFGNPIPNQQYLDSALALHQFTKNVFANDLGEIITIRPDNQSTMFGLKKGLSTSILFLIDSYEFTSFGDGTVTRESAALPNAKILTMPSQHYSIPSAEPVLRRIVDLVANGLTSDATERPPDPPIKPPLALPAPPGRRPATFEGMIRRGDP